MDLFNVVCCGGTFDHFHKGHREILKECFLHGKKVIIGLTSDDYVKNNKSGNILEDYREREKSVMDFLKKEYYFDRAEIIPINDLFGPTLLNDFKCDALVVSRESIVNAGIINRKRQEFKLKPLEIIIKETVCGIDGRRLSSSRIREGEIDREGKTYFNPQWLNKDLAITPSLRRILEKPFGKLIQKPSFNKSNAGYLVTVGDVVTKTAKKMAIPLAISVVDFKVNRLERFKKIEELGFSGTEILLIGTNPSGHLTSQLFSRIFQAVKLAGENKSVILKLEGEEDLAVLPLVISLPLGSRIFYGQRKQGLVEVEVSEERKRKAFDLINQFENR